MSKLNHEEQLHKIFTNINEWLKFAEAKNFGLLSLNAAIVFGFTQIDFQKGSQLQAIIPYALIPCLVASFLVSLISLFPILSKIEKGEYIKSWINSFCNFIDKEIKFENIYFYGSLKDIDEAQFEEKYLSKTESSQKFSQFERELSSQILYNSRITWLKYQLFKIAAFLFLAGTFLCLVLWAIFKVVALLS